MRGSVKVIIAMLAGILIALSGAGVATSTAQAAVSTDLSMNVRPLIWLEEAGPFSSQKACQSYGSIWFRTRVWRCVRNGTTGYWYIQVWYPTCGAARAAEPITVTC
jgi:hypothetical protein